MSVYVAKQPLGLYFEASCRFISFKILLSTASGQGSDFASIDLPDHVDSLLFQFSLLP